MIIKMILGCLWWMTFSLYTDDDYLPFLNLGDTSGISQIYISSSLDGASSAISTPNFAFGSSNQSLAYVRKPHLVIDPMEVVWWWFIFFIHLNWIIMFFFRLQQMVSFHLEEELGISTQFCSQNQHRTTTWWHHFGLTMTSGRRDKFRMKSTPTIQP